MDEIVKRGQIKCGAAEESRGGPAELTYSGSIYESFIALSRELFSRQINSASRCLPSSFLCIPAEYSYLGKQFKENPHENKFPRAPSSYCSFAQYFCSSPEKFTSTKARRRHLARPIPV